MIWIDKQRKVVWCNGTEVLLPPNQFALCAYLASEPGVIRSRNEIMEAIEIKTVASYKAVDTLVRRVRDQNPVLRTQIITRMCWGYYWREELIG